MGDSVMPTLTPVRDGRRPRFGLFALLFVVLLCGATATQPAFGGSIGAKVLESAGDAGVLVKVSVAVLQAAPVEEQLSAGTTGMLRSFTQSLRRLGRVLSMAALRWQMWLGGALAFGLLVVVAPVLDRSLLETWRRDGLRAFVRSGVAAMAVYMRLLRDSRSPILGKSLLVFAVVYGVSSLDILPDAQGFPRGVLDDLVLVVLTSRSFMRMCPDWLIEEHALIVASRQPVG